MTTQPLRRSDLQARIDAAEIRLRALRWQVQRHPERLMTTYIGVDIQREERIIRETTEALEGIDD